MPLSCLLRPMTETSRSGKRTKRIYYHVLPNSPIMESPLALAIVGNDGQSVPPQNTAIVKALLDRGANPNDPNPPMDSLVANTSMMNKPATINLLLRYGADSGARDFKREYGVNGSRPMRATYCCGNAAEAWGGCQLPRNTRTTEPERR